MIEQAVAAEKALLISSTLPAKTEAALKALVDPAVEQLGGEEVVSDYEVEVPEEAPAEEAAPVVAAAAVAEAAPAAAAPDDLTQLAGVGPKASAALASAGITTYAALAEANEPTVRHALHEADMAPPANVGTWPMQASYAAKGDWQGLMKYNKKNAEPSHSDGGEGKGSQGQGRAAGRPDPAQRDRATDLVDPERWRHHDLRGARAHRSLGSAQGHRPEWGPAALQPRFVADAGVIRGARRLAGARDLQQPQVASSHAKARPDPGRAFLVLDLSEQGVERMSGSNKEVIRQALAAYNAADWDGLDTFFDPEYVHHNNADDLSLAQFKRGAAWLRQGFPDFRISIEDMVAEADKVAIRMTGRGTHLGSLSGESPTSRTVTVYGAVLYRLDKGRVVEDWESLDEGHLRRQIEPDAE